jgi:twitching motility protein PilT
MQQEKTEHKEEKRKDIDLCFQSSDGNRNRINIYRQQGHRAIAIRLLNDHIPTLDELHMPPVFQTLTGLHQGLVLVTGPTGSGKSTTLAACLGEINRSQRKHIITIEDPVEYRHINEKSMVNQREIGVDTDSFADALRSALREDPDVILVGEMRDLETISAAITAAETGHLVFSTLHTIGSAATIERIVGVFPPHQQQQIRTQLATVLKAVISQQLVPKADGEGRLAAQEIMLVTDAVANMIREDKCHQIATVLQTGAKMGMQSMDAHLLSLLQQREITPETAVDYAIEKPTMLQKAGLAGAR